MFHGETMEQKQFIFDDVLTGLYQHLIFSIF